MKKVTNSWHSLGELSVKLFAERVQEELRATSTRRLSVREEERTMIAREIHDELGQVLAALKMDLSSLNNKMIEGNGSISGIPLLREIQSMSNLIDSAILAMRRLIAELRPEVLEHFGFKGAIEWQAQQFHARTKIPVEIRSDLEKIEIVDHDCATSLFRIFQEALANIGRHAKASRVETTIQENKDFFIMQVKDDGVGIRECDLSKNSCFGLVGLKERASLLNGDLDIQSAPNQGTTIIVRLPLAICKGANRRNHLNNRLGFNSSPIH